MLALIRTACQQSGSRLGEYLQYMRKFIMYELRVPNGTYKEDSLFKLFTAVFLHRIHHLIKDKKFMD